MTSAWRRFWDGPPESPDRVRLFRLVFFGLVAVDCLRALPRAALYGAGGFNLPQLGALAGWLPLPSPGLLVALWLFGAWLAALVALGAGRATAALLAAVYGLAWASSQIDGYQHHYLLALVLGVLAAFDPERPQAWPLRLVRVQLSIVYAWAVVAKLDPLWFDGSLLGGLATPALRRFVQGAAWAIGVEPETIGAALAVGVVAVEAFLAIAIHVRRLWPVAWPAGVALHLGIELAGFEIELFSAYLFALYLLVLPERWLVRLPRWRTDATLAPAGRVALWAAGAAAVLVVPLPGAAGAAALVAAWALLARASPIAHVVAGGLIAAGHFGSHLARDFHATRGTVARALGEPTEALAAWEAMLRLDPGFGAGWVNLGDLHLDAGRAAAALAAFERAEALTGVPLDARKARALAALTPPCRGDCARRGLARLERDPAGAAGLLGAGCEEGDPAACAALAGLHAVGRGVARDDAAARRLYDRACQAGRANACSNLGYLLVNGRGGAADVDGGRALLARGCDAGDAFGCRQLDRR